MKEKKTESKSVSVHRHDPVMVRVIGIPKACVEYKKKKENASTKRLAATIGISFSTLRNWMQISDAVIVTHWAFVKSFIDAYKKLFGKDPDLKVEEI